MTALLSNAPASAAVVPAWRNPWPALETIYRELNELRNQFDRVVAQYRAVVDKDRRWKGFVRQRNVILFTDDLGRIARLPRHLARLLAEDRPFDGEIQDFSEDMLHFIPREGLEYWEVPKSLVAQIRGLLRPEPS
jgi:hypothetical protein